MQARNKRFLLAEDEGMKQKSVRNYIVIFVAIVAIIMIAYLIVGGGLLKIVELSYLSSKVEITTDLDMYQRVIGENVDEQYTFKTGEHENIFPSTIEDLNVSNFQMVYYNPWDPQYIAWLEVTYDEQAYQSELKRLEQYGIEEYIGEYGATGFSEYDVQAMDVLDQHYGMVYALRDDEKRSITYVELFFCNYFYDLEYWKYIDESLLPEHFDAKMDNAYREIYLEE